MIVEIQMNLIMQLIAKAKEDLTGVEEANLIVWQLEEIRLVLAMLRMNWDHNSKM